jgi:hypothetical protein
MYRVHLAWARFELTTLVVIVTDFTGSCISKYHPLTTMTAQNKIFQLPKSLRHPDPRKPVEYFANMNSVG